MDNPISRPLMAPAGQTIDDRNNDWSMVDLSLGARVARGILYIDRCYPKRLAYLNPFTLDIGSCSDCVLGQLHGDYVNSPEFQLGQDFLNAHGFRFMLFPGDDGCQHEERELLRLWRKAIWDARDQI